MGKVFIQESTLTSIGDAIRAKSGKSDLISPTSMATEIANLPSGGGGGFDIPVITGDCEYRFGHGGWDWFIEQFGDNIVVENADSIANMFYYTKVKEIPFDINCNHTSDKKISSVFYNAKNLETLPNIYNCVVDTITDIFYGCEKVRIIPEDYFSTWDFSKCKNATSNTSNKISGLFNNCYSLRKLPMEIFYNCNPYARSSYSIYNYLCNNCYSLDEIVDLPNAHPNATMNDNSFNQAFLKCYRLKEFTFKTPEGKPYIVDWKNQRIDLSSAGYGTYGYITAYNSGITIDKQVNNDTTYQALKNDPDWFATNEAYSRYNHDSAVNTINSLPDTSAYLATAGGTNTIKFKGALGSATDGGAINTLTEEEIAVAAAKGWTVSFV